MTVDSAERSASGVILLTLATGQFLMTLDSSVMNVSISEVAEDVGTTVTGIQTAITLYTLVMATLMITGGKIGSLIGRKRAFAIGCVIYGVGTLITAFATNLAVLILGWSVLEGIGRSPDHACHGRPGRFQFFGPGAAPCLRAGGFGRSHCGRRRTTDRRIRDDLLDLALCVCRRSRPRGRDPVHGSKNGRFPAGGQVQDGLCRHRPLRPRARSRGVRRPQVRRVGLGPAQA